eukprot:g1443.t1
MIIGLTLCTATAAETFAGYELPSPMNCTASECIGRLRAKPGDSGLYGPPVAELQLDVKYEGAERLHLSFTDANHERWEVPGVLLPESESNLWQSNSTRKAGSSSGSSPEGSELQFSASSDPFGFSIKRKGESASLLSSLAPFVFKDQYLQFATTVSTSDVIYGIGQHARHSLDLQPGKFTLWNHDEGQRHNMYGHHPFYLVLQEDGTGYGVFLLNSNAMDVSFDGSSLLFQIMGGIIDLYVFAGPSPLEVVQQYHSLVGFSRLPPYWALGLHQCRWGYQSTNFTRSVVEGYIDAKIPLDTIWNDIDHMGSCEAAGPAHGGVSQCSFSYNRNFSPASQRAFLNQLHSTDPTEPLGGRHYVLIFDPAIGNATGYAPYEQGKALDIFIKAGDGSGEDVVGKLWPGSSVWPDFLHPNSSDYWEKLVRDFHAVAPFDGMWLDENEISNMELKRVPITNPSPAWSQPCYTSKWCNPPFSVNNTGNEYNLSYGTMPADAIHRVALTTGSALRELREYDAHSLYGALEAQASAAALIAVRGKRPFVISRSTFPGISGRAGGMWLGDMRRGYETSVEPTIPGTITMGLFGIALSGADLLAQTDPAHATNDTIDVSLRALQTGALSHMFLRNHGGTGYFMKSRIGELAAPDIARAVIVCRYTLLPYIYTLLHGVSEYSSPSRSTLPKAAGKAVTAPPMVVGPLAFYFGLEAHSAAGGSGPDYRRISTQFMLGKALMVCPVVRPHSQSRYCVFPSASRPDQQQSAAATSVRWFDYHTFALLPEGPENRTVSAPIDTLPAFVRGGAIIPLQPVADGGTVLALTTVAARKRPFELLVAIGANGGAAGDIYLDDGDSVDVGDVFTKVGFHASATAITLSINATVLRGSFMPAQSATLNTLRVLLAAAPPAVADGAYRCEVSVDGAKPVGVTDVAYDAAKFVLEVGTLSLVMTRPWQLQCARGRAGGGG